MKYFWIKYQQEMGLVKDESKSVSVSIDLNSTEKLSSDTSEEFYSCAQKQPVSSPIRKFGKIVRCNPDGKLAPTIKCLNQSVYKYSNDVNLDITFGLIDLDDLEIDSNENETLSEVSFILTAIY